ncbi:3'-5' exonuclease [Methanoplanus endosymbiosus]|uniref:3'-5' exonuclease n=1 Tax=Methanoplanus endosymbiosus TaxID=33865 RepID=A0A9E7PM61_9EURY|nr:3'-5' exonuclease [Methanoplanus endosymbiosus]UUX91406.1 3'-5' exonuclease [Methanoplanus endosymbiosus]
MPGKSSESKTYKYNALRKLCIMYLFFDVETNGFPRRSHDPSNNEIIQPRVVQIAFARYSEDGEERSSYDAIVKPLTFSIPMQTVKVHGITRQKALKVGIPGKEAFSAFSAEVKKSRCLVAHNISFDYPVVCAELARYGIENEIEDKESVCTMRPKPVKDYCALPRKNGGYKTPKLSELHEILFGESFAGAHDAAADVRACARCFFELKKRGVL